MLLMYKLPPKQQIAEKQKAFVHIKCIESLLAFFHYRSYSFIKCLSDSGIPFPSETYHSGSLQTINLNRFNPAAVRHAPSTGIP